LTWHDSDTIAVAEKTMVVVTLSQVPAGAWLSIAQLIVASIAGRQCGTGLHTMRRAMKTGTLFIWADGHQAFASVPSKLGGASCSHCCSWLLHADPAVAKKCQTVKIETNIFE
jgi:hypothetical protein